MSDAMLTVRTDRELKQSVGKILNRLGLTHSSAVNIFYHMVKEHNGIPFPVEIPNKTTVQAMEEAESGKGLKKADDLDDLFKKLDS